MGEVSPDVLSTIGWLWASVGIAFGVLVVGWITAIVAYVVFRLMKKGDPLTPPRDEEFSGLLLSGVMALSAAGTAFMEGMESRARGVQEHVVANWKIYTLLMLAWGASIFVANFQPQVFAAIDMSYNCAVRYPLRYAVAPLANIVRIVFDMIIHGWNAIAMVSNMIQAQLTLNVIVCSASHVATFFTNLGLLMTSLLGQLAIMLSSAPICGTMDVTGAGEQLADAFNFLVNITDCLCHDPGEIMGVVLYFPAEPTGRIVQGVFDLTYGLAIRSWGCPLMGAVTGNGTLTRPADPIVYFDMAASIVTAAGDWLDDWLGHAENTILVFFGAGNTSSIEIGTEGCLLTSTPAVVEPQDPLWLNVARDVMEGIKGTPFDKRILTRDIAKAGIERVLKATQHTRARTPTKERERPATEPFYVQAAGVQFARDSLYNYADTREVPYSLPYTNCTADVDIGGYTIGAVTYTCDNTSGLYPLTELYPYCNTVGCRNTCEDDYGVWALPGMEDFCARCDQEITEDGGHDLMNCAGVCVYKTLPASWDPSMPHDNRFCDGNYFDWCYDGGCTVCDLNTAPPDCTTCVSGYTYCETDYECDPPPDNANCYNYPLCIVEYEPVYDHQICFTCNHTCVCETGYMGLSCSVCDTGYEICMGGTCSLAFTAEECRALHPNCTECQQCSHVCLSCDEGSVVNPFIEGECTTPEAFCGLPEFDYCEGADGACSGGKCGDCNYVTGQCEVCDAGYLWCGLFDDGCVAWECTGCAPGDPCEPCGDTCGDCPVGYTLCGSDLDPTVCTCETACTTLCFGNATLGAAYTYLESEMWLPRIGGILASFVNIGIIALGWGFHFLWVLPNSLYTQNAQQAALYPLTYRVYEFLDITSTEIDKYIAPTGSAVNNTLHATVEVLDLWYNISSIFIIGQSVDATGARNVAQRARDLFEAGECNPNGDMRCTGVPPIWDREKRGTQTLAQHASAVFYYMWTTAGAQEAMERVVVQLNRAGTDFDLLIAPVSNEFGNFIGHIFAALGQLVYAVHNLFLNLLRVFSTKYYADNAYVNIDDLTQALAGAASDLANIMINLRASSDGFSFFCEPVDDPYLEGNADLYDQGDLVCRLGLTIRYAIYSVVDVVQMLNGVLRMLVAWDDANESWLEEPLSRFTAVAPASAGAGFTNAEDVDIPYGDLPKLVENLIALVVETVAALMWPLMYGYEAVGGEPFMCGADYTVDVFVTIAVNIGKLVTLPGQWVWWIVSVDGIDINEAGVVEVIELVLRPIVSYFARIFISIGQFFNCVAGGTTNINVCTDSWSDARPGCFIIEVTEIIVPVINLFTTTFASLVLLIIRMFMEFFSADWNAFGEDFILFVADVGEVIITAFLDTIKWIWWQLIPADWRTFLDAFATDACSAMNTVITALTAGLRSICNSLAFVCNAAEDAIVLIDSDVNLHCPNCKTISFNPWNCAHLLCDPSSQDCSRRRGVMGDVNSTHVYGSMDWEQMDFFESAEANASEYLHNLTYYLSLIEWPGYSECDWVIKTSATKDFLLDLNHYEKFKVLVCATDRMKAETVRKTTWETFGYTMNYTNGTEPELLFADFPQDFFYNKLRQWDFAQNLLAGVTHALLARIHNEYNSTTIENSGVAYAKTIRTIWEGIPGVLFNVAERFLGALWMDEAIHQVGDYSMMRRGFNGEYVDIEDSDKSICATVRAPRQGTLARLLRDLRCRGMGKKMRSFIRAMADPDVRPSMKRIFKEPPADPHGYAKDIPRWNWRQRKNVIEERTRVARMHPQPGAHMRRSGIEHAAGGVFKNPVPEPPPMVEENIVKERGLLVLSGTYVPPAGWSTATTDTPYPYQPDTLMTCSAADALHPPGGIGFCCAMLDDIICSFQYSVDNVVLGYGTVFPQQVDLFSDFFAVYYAPLNFDEGLSILVQKNNAMRYERRMNVYAERFARGEISTREMARLGLQITTDGVVETIEPLYEGMGTPGGSSRWYHTAEALPIYSNATSLDDVELTWQETLYLNILDWLFSGTSGAYLDSAIAWVMNTRNERTGPLDTDVGLLFWVDNFFICRWYPTCDESQNMTLWVGIWTALKWGIIISVGMSFLFDFSLFVLLVVNFGVILLFVTYTWSPFCALTWYFPYIHIPAFPTCLADDMMDVVARLTPTYINWRGFVTSSSPGTCAAPDSVYSCKLDAGFGDGFDSLVFFAQWVTPTWLDAVRGWGGAPFTWVGVDAAVVMEQLSAFTADDTAIERYQTCFFLTIGNLSVLVLALLGILLALAFVSVIALSVVLLILFIPAALALNTYVVSRILSGGVKGVVTDMRIELRERWRDGRG